jgi:hypothetical protein
MNTTKGATGSWRKRKLDEVGSSPTLGKGKGLKNENGRQVQNKDKSKGGGVELGKGISLVVGAQDVGDKKPTQELEGGKPTQDEDPPEEDACVICMEEKGRILGKLECCPHTFCAPCILKVIFCSSFTLSLSLSSSLSFCPCSKSWRGSCGPWNNRSSVVFSFSPPLQILSLQWSKTSNTCPICVRRFKTVTEVCEKDCGL